ncbi:MAG: GtrA family protein [Anaerovoracaceae bacterium]
MKNKEKIRELSSYLIVGILTTIVNVGVFWIFNRALCGKIFYSFHGESMDVGYLIANTIAWGVAVLFAFLANKHCVFKSKTTGKKGVMKEFGLFIAARMVSFVFEQGWLILTISVMNMNDLLSKITACLVVVAANYILSKKIIFKKGRRE